MKELVWHPTYAHICYNPEAGGDKYDFWEEGWYFTNEAEQLEGPYGSAEAAKEALDEYTENFL